MGVLFMRYYFLRNSIRLVQALDFLNNFDNLFI
jgi:hypothetical protein